MVATVFFADAKKVSYGNPLVDKLRTLWEKAKLDEWICEGDRVLVKTHFGYLGATLYLRPVYLWKLVQLIKEAGGTPVVGETCGLGLSRTPPYNGTTLPGYVKVAAQNGHSLSSLEAPVVMLDGYWGTDTVPVEVNGKHLKFAHVAMGLSDFDKVIVAARFKGHDGFGFGGALKQLGVGCVGKQGKGLMHYGEGNVYVKSPENCDACGKCLRACPPRCISLVEGKPVIDEKRCVVCLHCIGVCNEGKKREQRVFSVRKYLEADEQVVRMTENALGVLKMVGAKNVFYLNFALDINLQCDCVPFASPAIVPDQGVLASKDPVAIDQACVDLVAKARGIHGSMLEDGVKEDDVEIKGSAEYLEPGFQKLGFMSVWVSENLRPKIVELQLAEAERQGLGTRKYSLLNVD